ncbi:serine/threonine-protein kinase PknK [Pseudoalteromonas luteoviolacea]|uniref:Protein kinase domain-containing protein n=1 Tax=Pseudoalteromonas luteoviolacea S4054 TaxID=1129367 RepID=A0A0F6ADV6_9GAMM|nr:serine/threonine-protein kinase [Pseudoalteromonas luteoviolacea]AOT08389.1 hypothetical protein S4054249_11270 [Pseudoalteromonas luteoviolacea]AOT13305.1 hypothetical protein S40542_11245 [Pseudoalteromonas luteoviolacea]AOT18218.1 hypothetical protein S4054_11245 [Pseudoalteromonas luteoviolacea]KKE84338.1 hypothetical protein N479_10595 [Pseudoalteromonas luteoviolacea S4054]KZN76057.1 hypothetical protein N481_06820 [Pseudoalteromonas luteoviolacea S4047-1]
MTDITKTVTISALTSANKRSSATSSLQHNDHLGPFILLRLLGKGAMGSAYQAWDTETNNYVVIKTIGQMESTYLYNLKREFREISYVYHENIVNIHELRVDKDLNGNMVQFIVMEYVDGVDLLTYVRQGLKRGQPLTKEGLTKLQTVLPQLIEATSVLHRNSLLHCDLKPSNILVDHLNQVKVLDFGIALSLTRSQTDIAKQTSGTLGYMAPEHHQSQLVSKASDYFSLGVIIFELLTGKVPIRNAEYCIDEQDTLPSRICDIDIQYDNLCRSLLCTDPAQRATEQDLKQWLNDNFSAIPQLQKWQRLLTQNKNEFVGHDDLLAKLFKAYKTRLNHQPVCFALHGEAGIGKTTIVNEFIHQLYDEPNVMVFQGRCFAADQLPFNALDMIVDQLFQYIREMSEQQQTSIFTSSLGLAAQLFPILKPLVKKTDSYEQHAHMKVKNPTELRIAAFNELKTLLNNLSQKVKIVLFIDDIHWGDVDSAELLAELLSPPNPVNIFCIVSYRKASLDSPFLSTWKQYVGNLKHLTYIDEPVSKLSETETEQLVSSYFPDTTPSETIKAITESAQCHPFFATEIARFYSENTYSGKIPTKTVIGMRLDQLSKDAKSLMEVICAASRPLSKKLVLAVVDANSDAQKLLSSLQSARLVRSYGARPGMIIEPYHDRIRTAVLDLMNTSETKQLNLRWAEVLEQQFPEPDLLAYHYHLGDKLAKAADYAIDAARRAEKSMAFDQAAIHYEKALDWGSFEKDKVRELIGAQANAYFNAGRCQKAAPLFLESATLIDQQNTPEKSVAERHKLFTRHIEALLVSGNVEQGIFALRQALKQLNVNYKGTNLAAGLSFVKNLVLLLIKGSKLQRQPTSSQLSLAGQKADLCWAGCKGLLYVQPLQGADLMLRSLHYALKSGDPIQVGRSLAAMGAGMFSQIKPLEKVGQRYLVQAKSLAEKHDDNYLKGVTMVWQAFSESYSGNFKHVKKQTDEAISFFVEHTVGTPWERQIAQAMSAYFSQWLGLLPETINSSYTQLREARRGGDLYSQVLFLQSICFCQLAQGKVDEIYHNVAWIEDNWLKHFTIQHFYNGIYLSTAHYLDGDYSKALNEIEKLIPEAKRHGAHRAPISRIDLTIAEARLRVTLWDDIPKHSTIRQAPAIAKSLEKEVRTDCQGHAKLIYAAMAFKEDSLTNAIKYIEEAIEIFEKNNIGLYLAHTKRRKGLLTSDDKLVQEADELLLAQGVVSIERTCELFTPGFS